MVLGENLEYDTIGMVENNLRLGHKDPSIKLLITRDTQYAHFCVRLLHHGSDFGRSIIVENGAMDKILSSYAISYIVADYVYGDIRSKLTWWFMLKLRLRRFFGL
jgi:hypothetical protein